MYYMTQITWPLAWNISWLYSFKFSLAQQFDAIDWLCFYFQLAKENCCRKNLKNMFSLFILYKYYLDNCSL